MFKKLLAVVVATILGTGVSSGTAGAVHAYDVLSAAALSSYQVGLSQVSTDSKRESAQRFIDDMGKKAISFLGDEKLSQGQKERKFRNLLHRSFDLSTIGRFALGRNWKIANANQRKEYQKLFENMVVEVYSARFGEYKGQKFDVTSVRDNGKKDVLVTSYIVPSTGSKVQVDWRVRNKDGKNKVIDIVIEGVSMSLTQRNDFSSVIQRGGGDIEVLLSHLRK